MRSSSASSAVLAAVGPSKVSGGTFTPRSATLFSSGSLASAVAVSVPAFFAAPRNGDWSASRSPLGAASPSSTRRSWSSRVAAASAAAPPMLLPYTTTSRDPGATEASRGSVASEACAARATAATSRAAP